MELSITDSPIQSLLGFVDKENDIIQVEGQWVNLSLKVWREVVKCFKLQRDIKMLRWPAYDPDFIPALQDHIGIDSGLIMVLLLFVRPLKRASLKALTTYVKHTRLLQILAAS